MTLNIGSASARLAWVRSGKEIASFHGKHTQQRHVADAQSTCLSCKACRWRRFVRAADAQRLADVSVVHAFFPSNCLSISVRERPRLRRISMSFSTKRSGFGRGFPSGIPPDEVRRLTPFSLLLSFLGAAVDRSALL
jgi:hypothetical protein